MATSRHWLTGLNVLPETGKPAPRRGEPTSGSRFTSVNSSRCPRLLKTSHASRLISPKRRPPTSSSTATHPPRSFLPVEPKNKSFLRGSSPVDGRESGDQVQMRSFMPRLQKLKWLLCPAAAAERTAGGTALRGEGSRHQQPYARDSSLMIPACSAHIRRTSGNLRSARELTENG
ncbi:unnamed protein product [Pleuronectes platessa]|uniref:Uncharacterized protein n=1 Tax=Pleuronectes platessa TaxID=8262 RepID=A0A9N7Z8S1_PLEPL|nr:unnamed protein product [Pleuronectes platessa]